MPFAQNKSDRYEILIRVADATWCHGIEPWWRISRWPNKLYWSRHDSSERAETYSYCGQVKGTLPIGCRIRF